MGNLVKNWPAPSGGICDEGSLNIFVPKERKNRRNRHIFNQNQFFCDPRASRDFIRKRLERIDRVQTPRIYSGREPHAVPSDEEDWLAGGEKEFGTLTIRTTVLDAPAEQVFQLFRLRQRIGQFFTAYHDTLQQDISYLRGRFYEEGWLFLNHLSVITTSDTLEHIQSIGQAGNISARDWYESLRAVQGSLIGGRWTFPPLKEDLRATCELFHFDPTDLSGLGLN